MLCSNKFYVIYDSTYKPSKYSEHLCTKHPIETDKCKIIHRVKNYNITFIATLY